MELSDSSHIRLISCRTGRRYPNICWSECGGALSTIPRPRLEVIVSLRDIIFHANNVKNVWNSLSHSVCLPRSLARSLPPSLSHYYCPLIRLLLHLFCDFISIEFPCGVLTFSILLICQLCSHSWQAGWQFHFIWWDHGNMTKHPLPFPNPDGGQNESTTISLSRKAFNRNVKKCKNMSERWTFPPPLHREKCGCQRRVKRTPKPHRPACARRCKAASVS